MSLTSNYFDGPCPDYFSLPVFQFIFESPCPRILDILPLHRSLDSQMFGWSLINRLN